MTKKDDLSQQLPVILFRTFLPTGFRIQNAVVTNYTAFFLKKSIERAQMYNL